MDKRLLDIRKTVKSKKPEFARQDSHKSGLNPSWRRPNGLHSKMRLSKRGYNKCVSPGYGSPRAVEGLHPSGLKIILVYTLAGLEKIEPKSEGAVIGSTVGLKNKILIVKKAKEKGVKLLNVKDMDKFLKDADEYLKSRKETKKSKEIEAKKKKEEKVIRKEEKQLEDLTDKEKKEMEKQEKDKLLTKREA